LYQKHGYKREDLILQTKWAITFSLYRWWMMDDHPATATGSHQSAGKTPPSRFRMTLLAPWKCRSAAPLRPPCGNYVRRILTHIYCTLPWRPMQRPCKHGAHLLLYRTRATFVQSASVTRTIRVFFLDWEKTVGARYRLCRTAGTSETGGIVRS
jgi:hypothetical protein